MNARPNPATLPETLPQNLARVLLMLRFGLVGGCVIMTGIAYFVGPDASAGADPEIAAQMPLVLAPVAAVSLGISLLGGRIFARMCANFQSAMVLRWAIAESATVIGLVLAFMGADPRVALALGALGALAILVQPGDARAYEAYRTERLGR
ncbi:MAG: hypothetical protein R3B09_19045 [Nannocystaceae bacterium]